MIADLNDAGKVLWLKERFARVEVSSEKTELHDSIRDVGIQSIGYYLEGRDERILRTSSGMTVARDSKGEPTWGASGGQATDVTRLETAILSLAILSTKKLENVVVVHSLTFSTTVLTSEDLSE